VKRGQTDLCGVLLIDKPVGPSSHDVVDRLRRITGEHRIGHAGTLDPSAGGLLVMLVGPATRLSDYLLKQDKVYEAAITFGSATDTDDAQGAVIATSSVPASLADPTFATSFLDGLCGHHLQVPPRYSALKKDGRTAYRVAREGGELPVEPRAIEIYAADLIAVTTDETGQLVWRCRFHVLKGTYIRAIARDIGSALGTVAHLSALSRTASGAAELVQAQSMDELEAGGIERVRASFADPLPPIGFPIRSVDAAALTEVINGCALPFERTTSDWSDAVSSSVSDSRFCAVVCDRRLYALYRVDAAAGALKAQVVFPGGIDVGIS
jgi:tRNA pseudouridine55 synthase